MLEATALFVLEPSTVAVSLSTKPAVQASLPLLLGATLIADKQEEDCPTD